jgi:hypothetical protein
MRVRHRSVRSTLAAGIALVLGVTLTAASQVTPAAGELTVTVTYKGKGEVRKGNEIGVFLFAEPNIGAASQPVAMQVIETNGGSAVFKNLTSSPVYIAVTYDEKGQYDEMAGPPPAGTPTAIHRAPGTKPAAQGPPAASPIKPGKDAKVAITFDATTRM